MQTATIILALGFAVIASVPDLEPLRTLREDSAAGLLARCALPVIVVVPIALGALFVKGRVAGWFDRGMGTALLVVALLALLCGLLWWCTAAVAAHERVSRDNEARFRSYFELGLIGMAITSPDKGVLEVNDELCNILGYERAELLRMTWGDLTEPEDLAADTAQFNRVLAGEIDGYSLDKQIVRKDGQIILATISVKCVRRADGSVNYFVALLQDITERKRAEERLEQAVTDRTASLRQAVAQMEEFSYTVSHDLRAPLRGMKAYTEILLQDFAASLPEEARQYLGRISANANRLDKMILDVLTLSRLARAEFQLERVDVDQLVRQIVEQHPGMQSPHARIEIEPLPDVFGHEPSLTQALSNLLNNAVKFVTPNVTPRVRVWGEQQDGHVRLWVTDNGIGVDPQYQGRLFNMFERVHPELKYEGTGVGLAIVRKAVERMGGKVGVESDGATGSRFWIEVKSADDSNNGGVRASRGWAGISDNKTCSAPPAQAA
jgi:PAS domain S-box-containing protein